MGVKGGFSLTHFRCNAVVAYIACLDFAVCPKDLQSYANVIHRVTLTSHLSAYASANLLLHCNRNVIPVQPWDDKQTASLSITDFGGWLAQWLVQWPWEHSSCQRLHKPRVGNRVGLFFPREGWCLFVWVASPFSGFKEGILEVCWTFHAGFHSPSMALYGAVSALILGQLKLQDPWQECSIPRAITAPHFLL